MFNQTNINFVFWSTLGRLLQDGAGHVCACPRAEVQSITGNLTSVCETVCHNREGGNTWNRKATDKRTMKDITGGLLPAVDGQSLGET